MANFFRANFGGVDLLLASLDGDAGVDWAVLSPHRGDQHALQNQGRKFRRVKCQILFVDQPSATDSYLDRYLAFEQMANAGTPQIFTHPMHGAYLAVIDGASYSASADELAITCTCDFLSVDEPVAVQDVGSGVAAIAGPEDVGVAGTAATAELASLGMESDSPADCLAAAEAWANGSTSDSRQVLLEVASLTSQIDDDVNHLDLLASYDRWAAWKAMIRLRYSIIRAARASTSSAARVVDYRVRAPTPLRVLCARLYSASVADERADEITRINGLRAPGLIPGGTTLRVPAAGLRSALR